ncbi:MAG: hypothetical protein LBJ00_06075 [Planctomycetaceae bacterium]|nr:hypothetical protein [Planctomycetaceae bacterium]
MGEAYRPTGYGIANQIFPLPILRISYPKICVICVLIFKIVAVVLTFGRAYLY